MKTISGFLLLSLVGLLAAAPVEEVEEESPSSSGLVILITEEYYSSAFVKYTGEHDIVNLLVPLGSLNFRDNQSSTLNITAINVDTVFFVEADTSSEGKRTYQGLYMLKDGQATKLLENGQVVGAAANDRNIVFFGASDGIYVYKNGSTEKYGSLTDSIIGMANPQHIDCIYILTEDNEVYNVTDNGNHKEKIDSIVNAKQIVLDDLDNLFYSDDKHVHVLTSEGVKKLAGIPENPTSLTLVKPPFIFDEGVPVIVNNYTCMAYPNGTCDRGIIQLEPNTLPSAYGSEAGLIQYYAREKKIYEFNLLYMLESDDLEQLQNFITENADSFQTLASESDTAS